jgi:hypothetical protein
VPEKFEPGVALAHYRQHGAGVEVHCGGCSLTSVLDLERVIEGLVARGLGGEGTGICQVGRTFHRPCVRCGAVNWQTRPAFPEQKNKGIPDRSRA